MRVSGQIVGSLAQVNGEDPATQPWVVRVEQPFVHYVLFDPEAYISHSRWKLKGIGSGATQPAGTPESDWKLGLGDVVEFKTSNVQQSELSQFE
jgi:hypothetical protein